MSRSQNTRLLREERRDIHAFLMRLGEDEWNAPSLCAGWTTLEVAAHLSSFLGVSRFGLVTRNVRFGTGTAGANRRSAATWRARGPSAILDALGNPDRIGLGFFAPGWALSEALLHHQDMRRALGRPRVVPAERLQVVLSFVLRFPTGTGANRRRRGITLVATDVDWFSGRGPEVRGPAEAILMTVAGRRSALADVAGPGKERLAGSLR